MLSEWLVSLSDKVISVRSKLCRATGTIGGGKVAFKIAGGEEAPMKKRLSLKGAAFPEGWPARALRQ